MIIERLKSVNSTNEYVKKYIKGRKNAIVTADMQTGGMGTKGRSFISKEGGLYLTQLKFYSGLYAKDAFTVMQSIAVAVCKTLMAFNVNAKIKWPNDIIVNGKKICGILINNSFSGELIDYTVAGIGLNVNNKIDDEIADIAISMEQVLGKRVDLNSVFLTLITNLSFSATSEEYKSLSLVLGKTITVVQGEKIYEAKAVDISSNGELVLESGARLSSAEVKIKI
ncbi:MAG: biotin--[Clostridia bacterium]|nr:biotin--[acetyl-CoA-carboxylase] ligase [Clostridia bacterium]